MELDVNLIERLKARANSLRASVLAARAEEREKKRDASKKKREAAARAKKLERDAARAVCDVRVAKARNAEKARCAKKKPARKRSAAPRPAPAAPLLLPAPIPRRKVRGVKKVSRPRLAATAEQKRAHAKRRTAFRRDEIAGLQFAIAQAEEAAQDAEDREDLRAASRHRARARELKEQLASGKTARAHRATHGAAHVPPGTWMPSAATRIRFIKGVLAAKAWTKIPGKERIYVDLTKMNGGANWNGGVGHRAVVLSDGSVELDERNSSWAGARTRDWHHDNKTIQKIESAVAAARGGA